MSDVKNRPARPIRVGVYIFFPAGGIGRYTYEWLRVLGRMPEVEAEIICTPDFQWKEAVEYGTWDGLRSISHPVPLLRRLRFVKGQFVNPLRSLRHVEEADLDIIHIANINHFSFPFWRKALEKSRARVTVAVHDVLRQKAILNRMWEDRQLKAFYRFADALFVHSGYQANELINFAGVAPSRIHEVPHGPYPHGVPSGDRETLRRRLGLPADRQVALFFGQIRDEKNLDGFIRAMALARADLHLLVAGAVSARHRGADHYRQTARQAGVADRVTFLDRFIPDEEVPDLFTAADWVTLPYSNAFTSQSGVLNVAAHYERPVLVSSSPVLHETVQRCDIGVACAGDSVPALAEGIERIAQQVRRRHAYAFAEYRDTYSWEENARRTLDVYRQLLGLEERAV
ncbi:glycosyltransferase [Rhodocaloribacter sp.]